MHDSMCSSRGSGIVSSADDVLEMSVVRGMRRVGGVCEMCMCLARGGVGGEWMRGLGLGFTNPVGTGGVCEMCMCLARGGVGGEWMRGLGLGFTNTVGTGGVCMGCGGVGSGWCAWARVWEGEVVLCLDYFVWMACPGVFIL